MAVSSSAQASWRPGIGLVAPESPALRGPAPWAAESGLLHGVEPRGAQCDVPDQPALEFHREGFVVEMHHEGAVIHLRQRLLGTASASFSRST